MTQAEALIIPNILQEPSSVIVLLCFENILLSLNACFVSKKAQAANNGTYRMKSFGNFNKPIRLRKKYS